MKDITRDAELNLGELKAALAKVEGYLKNAPKGRINIVERGKKKYYQHIFLGNNGEAQSVYTDDWKLISALIIKRYYVKVRPRLIKEIKALENFLSSYNPDAKNFEYTNLPLNRKDVVTPIIPTPESIKLEWESELCNALDSYSKPSGYVTNGGEEVRSKSELIIANELSARKDTLLYHYEPTLYLTAAGIDVHPDFSVINLKSGNIYYWEHAGMMDNPDYANRFVDKINKYVASGFVLGKDLIVTYESSVWHLNINVIRKTIESLV